MLSGGLFPSLPSHEVIYIPGCDLDPSLPLYAPADVLKKALAFRWFSNLGSRFQV
jgi:hypothetical protein